MAEKDKGNTNDAININQLFENSLQNEVTSSTGDVTVEEDTSADSADEILLFVDQSQGQNVQTLLQAALQQGNITTTADGTTCIELKKVSEVASVDQSEVTRLHLPLLSGDNEIINQSQDHGYAALTSSSSDINAGNITFSSDTASTLTQFANLTGSLAHSKLEAPEKIPKFSSGSIKLNEFLSKGSTVKVGEQMKKARSGSSNDKLEFASNFQDPSNVAVTEPGKINVGDEFYCLEDIEHALRQYEITHNVKLYKRDVRSIEALMKRSLKLQKLDQINMKLRYGQLLFCCVYGGKRKAQKLACVDESGVARYTDCKMFIRFGISSDGMKLVVNGMSEEHCHAEVVTEEQEQPVIVTNEGNAEELCLGAGFVDIDELYKAVHKYETDHHIHLWRRDGRTVEALARRAPGTAKKIMEANPGLRFAELRFCCSFGGGRQGDSKEKDHKSPNSLRQGCEMHIRFGVSDDGSQLVVKSMSEEHNHEISEETVLKEALHPELGSYISKLVWNDMHITADEVQRKLKAYVINEMFKDQTAPPHTRRQYFPTKKQIRYFMAKARVSMNITKESEVKLEAHAEKLREVHKDEKMIFNFRVKNNQGNLTLKHDETNELEDQVILSSTVNTSNDVTHEEDMENATILFCHQTPHQQRMLKRYGVQVVLTKINDIHSKIPFPLYAVYVQTNVDYQLIAEFILQKNDNVMIAEALNTVKDWNPGWSPKFVVADNCEEQLTAVETCFPGSFILISDDAREKAWEEWLSSPANHLKDYKDEIVKHLQAIANSFSEDMLNVAAHELEDSETWKMSDHFRNWFQSNWLSQAKRWVKGYRPDDYIALNHTERLLEDEIRTFKGIKIINKANPLQDVIQHVVEHIVPAAKKQYETYNQESSRLQRELFYSYDDMPRYLTCRPGLLSRHIYERLRIAKSESFTITCLHPGIFTVQGMGNDDDILHTVSFGDITSYPSCDCADWLYHKLPCLHFAAVFNNYKSWNWDMLCASYKANPAFSIDWSVDGVVDNISEGRTDRSIQTTETLGTKSINSVGSSNSKVSLPEFRRFPETPQMLASQCRNLLQQLGKLQLAHQTRENLYHLKCELKELLSMLSKKSSSGVTIPYITSPKTERKVKSQLSDSSLSVFEQFNVKPVTPKEVVLGIRNPGALQRSNYSSNIQVTSGQGGYSNLKNTTEGNKIKVFRKRVGETDQSQIPSKTQVMDSNTLNDSDGVSSSFDVRESKEKTSLEESRSTENCEPAVVFISQFSDSEDFERTPVPIVLERSVAEDDVTSSVTASVTAQVSQPDSNSGEVPLIDAPARSENNLSTISSSNGSSSNTMIISNNIGSSSDTIIK